jgi:hypothetical protein
MNKYAKKKHVRVERKSLPFYGTSGSAEKRNVA